MSGRHAEAGEPVSWPGPGRAGGEVTAAPHGHGRGRLDGAGRRLLLAVLVPMAVATLAGLVWLWPGHRTYPIPPQFAGPGGASLQYVDGKVGSVDVRACEHDPRSRCQAAQVRLGGGPDAGSYTTVEFGTGPGAVSVRPGETLRLAVTPDPAGGTLTYAFVDIARGLPLALVTALFAVVVIAVARWRGLAALAGLGVAYGVLALFVLPALLAGKPPLAVGLVGGSLILFAVLYLAHGVSARTSAALAGTLLSMLAAAGLAALFTSAAHLTGLSSDVASALQTAAPQVSYTGLVLCGVVIGALGVLNDVTVTQAGAVWELHAAEPTAPARRVYRAAMRIGRDHIASSVYTLVLAYAGTALPLLLLVNLSRQSIGNVLTGDEVAAELLRGLIGATALVAAVPITTALSAYLVTRHARSHPPGRRRTR
jgi:uncharacterized membrane protein